MIPRIVKFFNPLVFAGFICYFCQRNRITFPSFCGIEQNVLYHAFLNNIFPFLDGQALTCPIIVVCLFSHPILERSPAGFDRSTVQTLGSIPVLWKLMFIFPPLIIVPWPASLSSSGVSLQAYQNEGLTTMEDSAVFTIR